MTFSTIPYLLPWLEQGGGHRAIALDPRLRGGDG